MRDKDGWPLSQKIARQYLSAVKMLYGPNDRSITEIALPRANLEVSGAVGSYPEIPGNSGAVCAAPALRAPRVPRGTLDKPEPLKEWKEQALIFAWTQTVPALQQLVMSNNHERKRTVIQAAVAKRMGLLPGASDLFIIRPMHGYAGLWLEVKQNRPYTPSQRNNPTWLREEAFQQRVKAVGFAAFFCYGFEQGKQIIVDYMNNTLRTYSPPA